MPVELNHTIVPTHDREKAANFLATLLDLTVGDPHGPFLPVQTANAVRLDFLQTGEEVSPRHYAFLVSENEFDNILDRIVHSDITYYADARHQQPGEIYHQEEARGLYFAGPSGHSLEILTRAYRSGT